MKKHNLVGQIFGRWTVLEVAPSKAGNTRWLCLCSCGTEKVLYSSSLRSGLSQSCGCYHRENMTRAFRTHGRTANRVITKEYRAWVGMKNRCFNPRAKKYPLYGGRGIEVAPEWIDDFEAFYKEVGKAPSEQHTLDRIEVDGNYEPGNVRWATLQEQANNRRDSIKVVYKDVAYPSISALARALSVNDVALRGFYRKYDNSVEKAVTKVLQRKERVNARKAS